MTTDVTPQRTISGIDELETLAGQELGVSSWVTVDQEMIDRFAEVTGDHQWIHVDVERCRNESPFGTTIAHGYLVLSLGPRLCYEVFTVEGVTMGVNYGSDRVRFIAPLTSGSRVRARVHAESVERRDAGVLAKFKVTFESEGGEKPVAVAEILSRLY
ncbi:MAG TPA: MaoC family dehydratase [Solirubrobacteraceae bacterium]|nr:MaoC family dehydratase [Solirubrobacteraceae bacterium]